MDADLVVRYVASRTAFHSRGTVCGVMTGLRSMGEFLVAQGLWRSNPLRWIRGPKTDPRRQLPRRIGRAPLEKLWATAAIGRKGYARHRAVCMLAILYATGLRRGELERLDLSDWDADTGTLTIDGRKTGQERRVPVGDGVKRCIEAYLPHRHNQLEATGRIGEPALLVSRHGRRLRGPQCGSVLKRLAACAGVAPVTLHQFRNTCASDLLEAGVAIPDVQRMLGHAGIESTMRYTAVADPARAAAMRLHPVNRFLAGAEEERTAP